LHERGAGDGLIIWMRHDDQGSLQQRSKKVHRFSDAFSLREGGIHAARTAAIL
jgi:hypothetical protein